MNDLTKLKLYENWLERGIELQESGKGNILGYEDKLTAEGVHEIKGKYYEICLSVFNDLFPKEERTYRQKDYVNWMKSSIKAQFICTKSCKTYRGNDITKELILDEIKQVFGVNLLITRESFSFN